MESQSVLTSGHIVKDTGKLPEVYADGVHEMFLGSPISKITFYSMDGATEDGREIRATQQRVIIPTGALLEMCRNILAFATENAAGLKHGYDLQTDYLSRLLSDVTITPAPNFIQPSDKPDEKNT